MFDVHLSQEQKSYSSQCPDSASSGSLTSLQGGVFSPPLFLYNVHTRGGRAAQN